MSIVRCFPFLSKWKVTSLYGYRTSQTTTNGKSSSSDHKGMDWAPADGDTRVCACESGTVKYSTYDSVLGNFYWIVTDSGYGVIYQHLQKRMLKQGDRVVAKQVIGNRGSTGSVTGPHLHFGVSTVTDFRNRYKGWINPASWLGIQNVSTIEGKVFDGSGYITGYAYGVNSTNNEVDSATSGTSGSYTSISGYLDSIIPSGEFYEVKDLVGTTGDWLYGRKYRILIDLGNGKAFDVSELRCTFSIVKTSYLEANQSTVTIYNLNPDDENKLIKEGQRIIIEAGYEGSQYGRIFVGNIIQPLRSKENGVDYKLTLISMDSDRYVTYGLVGVSLVAQQSSRDAVNSLLTKSSQQVGAGYLGDTSIKYPRGKVMFGMSRTYLNQLSNSENMMCYTEDGKVNLISASDVGKGRIFYFTPQNGLIGTPTQNDIGISCQVLLNPQIGINSLFKIDNSRIENYRYEQGKPVRSLDSQGIYRVIKLTHEGDTRQGSWLTKIDAISQAGILPEMMSGSSLYYG